MSDLRAFRGSAVVAVLALAAACGGQIDPNATQKTSARQTGTGSDTTTSGGSQRLPASSSSSSGGSSGDLVGTPPNTGPCGGTSIPFNTDFEDGTIDSSFSINTPSAFEVDYDDPIRGSASLKVSPTPASYIARKVANVCRAQLKFRFRASSEFLATGGNIARVNAGSRRFTIIVQPAGAVGFMEEVYGLVASGGGGPGSIGQIAANENTTLYLDVDLANEQTTLSFSAASGASGGAGNEMAHPQGGLQSEPAISSIEIGTTPGIESDPHGAYWVDDLEIL